MTEPTREPLWHGRHGKGAMRRHKDDLRVEAEERNAAYQEQTARQGARDLAAEKLLEDVHVPGLTMETVPAEPKRNRRRRNVTRQHKAE